ncbi:hydrogenase expression/formation protein HypE [Bacillus sp. B-jedd]|uniref:hydrogenase expression/formation protein HypE n=1 Tax=Bacillus sp. B-jedd TaxID=1476857 RepID=UPI0005155B6E|nr:hydrogenase expression/formation protein HypE [Bacillus sp. B-jedd]CEG27547.1 hydrogenase expression/formation protein HypE [Bacillus sp. B-jedd]
MVKVISLAHGDGGELSHRLIRDVFAESFGHSGALFDSASLNLPGTRIAVTTDTFVIKPIFFPGGTIGKLAVAGTVNDLSVSGAKPLYLTCGFVIEEGFPLNDLKKIVADMKSEADDVGVKIIAGDTKVVERGSADGVYINTTGIGVYEEGRGCSYRFEAGDVVIVTGTVGDHGVAVLAARGDLGIEAHLVSDCASLDKMLSAVLEECGGVRIMRDPTRGGLATTLVEIAEDFSITIKLKEETIPVKDVVHGVCDLVGFDPLYLANEGKAIIIAAKDNAWQVLDIIRSFPEGGEAAIIGSIVGLERGQLLLETPLGSKRILNRLTGTMVPRIC